MSLEIIGSLVSQSGLAWGSWTSAGRGRGWSPGAGEADEEGRAVLTECLSGRW